MTDLAIDKFGPVEGSQNEWEWPCVVAAPRTLMDTVLHPRPFLTRCRPDASASWAVDDAFHFDAEVVAQPVIRVRTSTVKRQWFTPLLKNLNGLLALGPNWNGYDESPVDPINAGRAISLLDEADFDGPEPALVPLHDGGVQVEWHCGERHLEVQLLVGRPPSAWWGDDEVDEEWDLRTSAGRERLRLRLAELVAAL